MDISQKGVRIVLKEMFTAIAQESEHIHRFKEGISASELPAPLSQAAGHPHHGPGLLGHSLPSPGASRQRRLGRRLRLSPQGGDQAEVGRHNLSQSPRCRHEARPLATVIRDPKALWTTLCQEFRQTLASSSSQQALFDDIEEELKSVHTLHNAEDGRGHVEGSEDFLSHGDLIGTENAGEEALAQLLGNLS